MTRDKLTVILKELREGVTELLGDRLDTIYLYGSHARGNARLVSRLSLENETVIALAFASSEYFEKRQIPFFMNIRCEGIPV